MKDSTRRALRSAYHTVVALIGAAPLLVSSLPDPAKGAAIVAAVAVVSKVINVLEDAGFIPAWLKDAPVSDTASVA